jgi:hypothetical protein
VKQGILGFVLGCVLTGAGLGIYASGLKAELSVAQTEARNQKMYAKTEQKNQEHLEEGKLQQVSEQRDTCQAKFSRATILYVQQKNIFGTPFGDPARSWAIPVDVEPTYIGPQVGLFSHYDPKTQMETVKFAAKTK